LTLPLVRSNAEEVTVRMISLIGGPYVPVNHAAAASTDWSVIAALIVVMAIALAAVFVYARRSTKTQAPRNSEPADSDRKAA
jgi:hypothetical protein